MKTPQMDQPDRQEAEVSVKNAMESLLERKRAAQQSVKDIDVEIAELRKSVLRLLNGKGTRGAYRITKEQRAKMVAGIKKRWARIRKEEKNVKG